jgi:hypothetical protein
MKIRFIKRHVVDLGEGRSQVYHAGDEHVFDGVVNEGYARKYIRRGWAEEVVSPLDLDGDGKAGGSKPAEPTDGVKTAAALLAALDGDPPMNFFTFKAEAKKILGDATPGNKDGIVAALQALVTPAPEEPAVEISGAGSEPALGE